MTEIPGDLTFMRATGPLFGELRGVQLTGETEIVDVIGDYLKRGTLHVEKLGRGHAWLDTGTPEAMIEGSEFVRTLENRTGQKIGCVEEVAYRQGFIDKAQLVKLAKQNEKSNYGRYLLRLAEEEDDG